LIDVQEVGIHGGSILLTAQHRYGSRKESSSIKAQIVREEAAGLHRLLPWLEFGKRVLENRMTLCAEIERLHAKGCRVAGYGAPAKGMTLLAYCDLDSYWIDYLVDRSPYKQGMVTPGHHIPIIIPEKFLADRPDVVLVLAWNFLPEIVRQQSEYLRQGGKFLVPIPVPHYWGGQGSLPIPNYEMGRRAA